MVEGDRRGRRTKYEEDWEGTCKRRHSQSNKPSDANDIISIRMSKENETAEVERWRRRKRRTDCFEMRVDR